MPGDLRIFRSLEFLSDANQESNVLGNFAPKKITSVWNFTDELVLDGTNKYTLETDTTSTIAVGAGGAVFTTAATDTKVASMALGGIFWYPAKNPVVEMTFSLDVVTTLAIYAGWNDAVTEGTGKLPFSLTTATLTDNATNAVGFLFDTNQTLSYWNVVNTNAGTQAFTQLASTYVPVAATKATIRVALESSGAANYFYNGVHIGRKLLATATTTPLVPFFGIRNNTATAHVATLRRVRAWCDE